MNEEVKKNERKQQKGLMGFLGSIVVEIVVTVIGLMCCIGIYFAWHQWEDHREDKTRALIMDWVTEANSIPSAQQSTYIRSHITVIFDKSVLKNELIAGVLSQKDSWGNDIRVVYAHSPNETIIRLLSPGSDGGYANQDDEYFRTIFFRDIQLSEQSSNSFSDISSPISSLDAASHVLLIGGEAAGIDIMAIVSSSDDAYTENREKAKEILLLVESSREGDEE